MNLNIRKLLRETGEAETGSQAFDMSGYDFGHFTVAAPVHLAWQAKPQGGKVSLEIALRATVCAECARCLAPVTGQVEAEKVYELREADLDEDFPELPLANGLLDLQELAYGEVLIEAPQVLLCETDCPGLCATCGKRTGTCGCEHKPPVDPRLAVLQQLLDEEN